MVSDSGCMHITRAGEPDNFFPAPAPRFFFKRLSLLVFFFQSAPATVSNFFQAAPAPVFFF